MAEIQLNIQSPEDIIRSAILSGIHDKLTQDQIAEKLGHKKSWLTYWLKKLGLNWKELTKGKIQQNREKSNNSSNNTNSLNNSSPGSQNRGKGPAINEKKNDLEGVHIGDQFKELIAHISYAQAHGVENVNLGQMTTLYEKTKQLENQEKEFEEDQKFLDQVEILCRELKIDNPQVDIIPPLNEVSREIELRK